VRFEVELPTRFCAHCHCSMCRRNHGAGYVTWFAVPVAQFRLTQGKQLLTRYASSDHGTRGFCSQCGTSLFCESTQRPDEIDIVLASMDGPIDREPQLHVFFSDRIDWLPVDEKLPQLGGPTGMEPIGPGADAPD
jgi:hypothetical protein